MNRMYGIMILLLLVLLLLILQLITFPTSANAFEDIKRRRDQFETDFGYFVYPIASTIPGLGTAEGAGATVVNIGGTNADFTGFKLVGDFKASGYALLDLHAIPRRLIFDVGYYDFEVAPVQYKRGITSDRNDFILPKAKGSYAIIQATLSFKERMFEVYVRELQGSQRLLSVSDKNGSPFDTFDSGRHSARADTVGGVIDMTDDRLDPRRGIRFEADAKFPVIDDPNLSKYFVTDYNLTGYIPFRKWDTLVLNLFHSDAYVTHEASTDFAILQKQIGLGCDQIPAGPSHDQCSATEASLINARIAENQHGTSTSLGGTQRLRSFDGGRFYAGHTIFYGMEYRLNLTDERTPFNIIIAKGVRTGVQLAFFVEQGTVFDSWADQWKNMKTSYGTGLRIVLSGVIIRVDAARGNEGNTFLIFINYPWSMFSVDSPG